MDGYPATIVPEIVPDTKKRPRYADVFRFLSFCRLPVKATEGSGFLQFS
jgi:hypothetical protein